MRLDQLTPSYLFEGILLSEVSSIKLWDKAGRSLMEAKLTSDQIQQIFQQAEQGATAAGGNRTLLGRGKDAAAAVNTAWEDLKSKVQNSGPIKNVDSTYDSVIAKIEAGLGGPDNAVNKVIQKYREFAKKHPVAQGLIYSALIAAAGISGAGLGGAAVLGLLKMTDKLLQGEKFSSAAYSGAKTGALAYGASKIGDLIKGKPDAAPTSTPNNSSLELDNWKTAAGDADRARLSAAYNTTNPDGTASDTMRRYMDADAAQKAAYDKIPGVSQSGSMVSQANNAITNSPMSWDEAMKQAAAKGATGIQQQNLARSLMKGASARAAGTNESKNYNKLTESQIKLIFKKIEIQQNLNEGLWDTIKGAAGKAMDYAKTKGHNLTTKVTADKLNTAWEEAGSPTDSDEIAKILKASGVEQALIDQTFNNLGISVTQPINATTATNSVSQTKTASAVQGKVGLTVGQINKVIPTLKMRDLQNIKKSLDAALSKKSALNKGI